MRTPRVVAVALVVAASAAIAARPARADGVCVAIDTTRDTLDDQERAAVRIAITTALEHEGVATDRDTGRCTATVVAYNVRIDRVVTTTLVSGDRNVTGKASSIDELDLLVRQLVRSLVTGRAFATGTGVQDRENVLRDQTAPRRSDAATRDWMPTIGVGGGMLQLPALADRPRYRQYSIVAIDAREWSFFGNGSNALEVRGRLVLHDYAVFGTAWDSYDAELHDGTTNGDDLGHAFALMFAPFGVANWEGSIGFASQLGALPPRPYVRLGASTSVLCRFSDPDHYIDLGLGFYVGLGFQLTDRAAISVEANVARPVVHDILDTGYAYFLTTTAMLEFRGDSRRVTFSPLKGTQ
jgi:hypothetical protein